jgi:hypothetical protein
MVSCSKPARKLANGTLRCPSNYTLSGVCCIKRDRTELPSNVSIQIRSSAAAKAQAMKATEKKVNQETSTVKLTPTEAKHMKRALKGVVAQVATKSGVLRQMVKAGNGLDKMVVEAQGGTWGQYALSKARALKNGTVYVLGKIKTGAQWIWNRAELLAVCALATVFVKRAICQFIRSHRPLVKVIREMGFLETGVKMLTPEFLHDYIDKIADLAKSYGVPAGISAAIWQTVGSKTVRSVLEIVLAKAQRMAEDPTNVKVFNLAATGAIIWKMVAEECDVRYRVKVVESGTEDAKGAITEAQFENVTQYLDQPTHKRSKVQSVVKRFVKKNSSSKRSGTRAVAERQ